MRDTQREAETQAEGEAGSMQGALCGPRSQDPGSRPGPKAGAKLLSHPGIPFSSFQTTVIQLYGQLIFDKAGKTIQWERDSLCGVGKKQTSTSKRMKLGGSLGGSVV